MTREEAINRLQDAKDGYKEYLTDEALNIAIQALEQEPTTDNKAFAEWVAEEIFDENWEYNKDAFAELACRKLAKLGIVRAKGDEWELVEPQESEKV